MTIDWEFTDQGTRYRVALSNGALIHWANPAPGGADLTLTLTRPQLLGMLAGKGLEGIQAKGDPEALPGSSACLIPPIPGSRSSHRDGAAEFGNSAVLAGNQVCANWRCSRSLIAGTTLVTMLKWP